MCNTRASTIFADSPKNRGKWVGKGGKGGQGVGEGMQKETALEFLY